MKVGQLAGAAGVSVQTIRFYERRGLLPVPPRLSSGYRDYPAEAVRTVLLIRQMQGLGFTLRELEHLFESHDFNGFPVVEGHHLIGIVTKFDFLKNFVFTPSTVFPHYEDLMKRTVEEIMIKKVSTVHPSTPLTRVLQLLVESRDKSFPVVDEKDRLVGMISRGDIIQALKA